MRNKRSLYSLLVVLFLCLGLGYAALTTNLSINGTAHVDNATWNVYWDNVQVTSGSVTAPTPTISNQTTVSYEITLYQPGDFFEFTVDAVNDGTVDAMIESIASTVNGNPITSLPSYLSYTVTYSDGKTIEANQLISANSTETYKVKILFRQDINPEDLPTSDQTFALNFGGNYVQASSSAVPVDHSNVVYVFNYSSDKIQIGQAIPAGVTQYETPEEIGKDVFVKCVVRNGVVDEVYLGRIINSPYYTGNGQVVYHEGTYYLRGGVNESSLVEKTVFNQNKNTIYSMFVNPNCTSGNIYYECYRGHILAKVSTSGEVYIEPYSGGGRTGCFSLAQGTYCSTDLD